MEEDNFADVSPADFKGEFFEENTIRKNESSISMSNDIGERFWHDPNAPRCRIAFKYSPAHKAIRLMKPSDNNAGFLFAKTSKSCISLTWLPGPIKRLNMPAGVYRQMPGHPDTYQYDEKSAPKAKQLPRQNKKYYKGIEITKYFTEPEVEVGDIVSWMYRAEKGDHSEKIGTGIVLSIGNRALSKRNVRSAVIKPVSKVLIAERQREKAIVSVSRLIVREKPNHE